MGFWFFLFVMTMILPLLLVGLGRSFQRNPPKKISPIYGYRTRRSMQNEETWLFAQRYAGGLWFRCGIVLLPVTALVMLLAYAQEKDLLSGIVMGLMGIQLAVLCGAIPLTERKLGQTFDAHGQRKE